MDCPKCKEPMIVLELDQVEIDYCISCEGIWLDAGELELLLEDSEVKDKFLATFKIDPANREKKVKCPVCHKHMEKILCGESKDVLIDRCRKNHGLWFDKGELHNVIEMGTLDENNKIVGLLNDMFAYKLKRG